MFPIRRKPFFQWAENKIFRAEVSTIPVFDSIDWDISQVGTFYFMNWFALMMNMCLKIIWRSLLHFIVLNFASDFILFIFHHKWMKFFNSASSEECSWKLICRVICLNYCSIFELEFSFSFISDFKWVHIWTYLHIIVTTEPVTFVRTINKEVTDWRMMTDLLHINLGPINKLTF